MYRKVCSYTYQHKIDAERRPCIVSSKRPPNLLRVNNCWHGLPASVWKSSDLQIDTILNLAICKNCLTTLLFLSHTLLCCMCQKNFQNVETAQGAKNDNQHVSQYSAGQLMLFVDPHFTQQNPSVTYGLPRRPLQSRELCIQICKTFVVVFYLPVNKILIWTNAVFLQVRGNTSSGDFLHLFAYSYYKTDSP